MNILRQFGIKLEKVNKDEVMYPLSSTQSSLQSSSQSSLQSSQTTQKILPQSILKTDDILQTEPKEFLDNLTNVLQQSSLSSQKFNNNNNNNNNNNSTNEINVFIDGSAIHNGSKNCRAGYAVIFPNHEHLNIAEPLSTKTFVATNNRAEYMACIRALEQASQEDPNNKHTLIIHSDSKLLIDSMTKWINGWKKNNWVKRDGKKVLNRDLLEKLCHLLNHRKVIWRHVRAHTGGTDYNSKWNDIADKMAKKAVSVQCQNTMI